MIDPSFVRFGLVGLANTAVGYAVILLLHFGVGVGPVLANVVGYAVGAALSYGLNRRFTFGSDRAHDQAVPRFGMAMLSCFALNLAVLEVGVSVLALPVALAQALAMGSFTASFYLTSRFLVFRA